MRFNTLFFLLITSYLSLTLGQVTFDDCCLQYVKKMAPATQKHAVDYRWQVTDGGCNIPAVVFIMRRGLELCTDPRENWVVKLMRAVDKKKGDKIMPKMGRKHFSKHKPRRPFRA